MQLPKADGNIPVPFGSGSIGKKTVVVTLLCLLTAVFGILSFYMMEKEAAPRGELYRAVLFLDEQLQENQAIAVFLGLPAEDNGQNTERADHIAALARQYIKEHEGEEQNR